MSATVVRIQAKSGNRDADYFRAKCPEHPSWISGMYNNRTIEGRSLAERDAREHNLARHHIHSGDPTCACGETAF